MLFWKTILGTFVLLAMIGTVAAAQEVSRTSCTLHESTDDAWWTGPMLAPSAATLPHGHFLIEPYLYDVITQGHYDHSGTRRNVPHSNGFGSLTYMLYGLTDTLTIGMIPVAGFNTVSRGPSSAGVGMGDLTVQAQYRLHQFHEGSWIPTMSFALQETLPTGQYDRLGTRPSDGFGSGTHTTTLALYSQTYAWLPNGRILRMRFNLSQAFSNSVNVHDASVYDTETGFRGSANPGSSSFVDASFEYSLRRSWVLALDLTYLHVGNTHVRGYVSDNTPSNFDTGSSDAFGLAPAIEYSWTSKVGVLLGVRIIPAGRNAAATITPAVAINFVH